MSHERRRPVRVILLVVLLAGSIALAGQEGTTSVRGMVVEVQPSEGIMLVSHDPIPGVMPAMIMPFEVRKPEDLRDLGPGAIVRFTLQIDADAAYADDVEVVSYQGLEQDPLIVRRLRLLRSTRAAEQIGLDELVPDFTLTDQERQRVTLSELRGKVVAVNFIYTSCVLPQFCYRMTNHFGVLQSRFSGSHAQDLVLLTITFDPARDTPERLAEYASEWQPDPERWHFLTGPTGDIERVAAMFGLDYYPDEGLFSHSVRTAVIDRQGRLVANVEGNRFTAQQLGDLVETVLDR